VIFHLHSLLLNDTAGMTATKHSLWCTARHRTAEQQPNGRIRLSRQWQDSRPPASCRPSPQPEVRSVSSWPLCNVLRHIRQPV